MKPSLIKDFVKLAIDSTVKGTPVNICFSGPPGLGKSTLVAKAAKELGYDYIDIRLAQMEAPDVRGIQKEVGSTGRLSYLIPDLWPASGKVIINLDEVNRAPRLNMNAVLQVLQERKVGNFEISKDAVIVSCINEGPEYSVNELDPALRDRFMFVPVEYSHNDFINYVNTSNFHPDIVSFLSAGVWVYKTPSQLGEDAKYMSSRSWDRFNSAYSNTDSKELRTLVGKYELGEDLHRMFVDYLAKNPTLLFNDFIENEKKAFEVLNEVRNRSDLLVSLATSISATRIQKEYLPLLGKIIAKLPADIQYRLWLNQLIFRDGDIIDPASSVKEFLIKEYAKPLTSKMSRGEKAALLEHVKTAEELILKKEKEKLSSKEA